MSTTDTNTINFENELAALINKYAPILHPGTTIGILDLHAAVIRTGIIDQNLESPRRQRAILNPGFSFNSRKN